MDSTFVPPPPDHAGFTACTLGSESEHPMSTPERAICIHGHFYQPPRENPWLETVEAQESAAPWHDWNARITTECYAPNASARIVDRQNQIIRILNNYARMSFNFGPTLLSWLEQNAPRVHEAIVRADARSQKRYSGHGSAMAQVYNHLIMPLASTRDRITQIRWGIADFEYRFHRKPEGMWLPETAVDSESLDLLAQHGIQFVLLAPHQCARARSLERPAPGTEPVAAPPAKGSEPGKDPPRKGGKGTGEIAWTETPNAAVDTTQPYLVRLKEGRSIMVFFYDGPRSRAIAFEGLLNSGEGVCAAAAERVPAGRPPGADGPCRHRRRELRPPSPLRRDGAGLGAAPV